MVGQMTPNCTFYVQVIDRALKLVSQTLDDPNPTEFMRAESKLAVEESREAIDALRLILKEKRLVA